MNSIKNNNLKVEINGTIYEDEISYPYTKTIKNLNDSLNLFEFRLAHTTNPDPYHPNQWVNVKEYSANELEVENDYILLSDVVEMKGASNKFDHKINLIEATYSLEIKSLPDMTITRLTGEYEPNLDDVVDKILATFSGAPTLSISARSILERFSSPEWTFTRLTVLEALRMVFAVAGLVPYMAMRNELAFVRIQIEQEDSATMALYAGQTKAYDPESFSTQLVSPVQNFLAGDEDNVIKTQGWVSPRSEEGLRVDADNAIVKTDYPIYELKKVLVKPGLIVRSQETPGSNPVNSFITPGDLKEEWIKGIDITDSIVESVKYNSLPNTAEGKGSRLFFEQGQRNIQGLGFMGEKKFFFENIQQAIRNILNEKQSNENYQDAFHWDEYSTEINQVISDAAIYPGIITEVFYGFLGPSFPTFPLKKQTDIAAHRLQFKIEYTPSMETTIHSNRERDKFPNEIISQKYYNPTATVIDTKVLAELHDRVLKIGSGITQNLSYLHKSYDSLPRMGRRFGKFVITAGDLTIGRNNIQSNYSIDEYFAKLNNYVAVLQRWRQFAIPNEDLVLRQFPRHRYARFDTSAKANEIINANLYIGDTEIQGVGVSASSEAFFLPVVSYAMNDQLVFDFKFENNRQAGTETIYEGNQTSLEHPIVYTNELGFLPQVSYFLAEGLSSDYFTLPTSRKLPLLDNVNLLKTPFFFSELNLPVNKDLREILQIVLNLHHVDGTGKVFINRRFLSANGTVGGIGLNEDIKLVYLNKKLWNRDYVMIGDVISTRTSVSFSVSGAGAVICPRSASTSPSPAQAYAIVNSENRVLYWVNEEVPAFGNCQQLYINFEVV